MITDRVKHFIFNLTPPQTLEYIPGQFITLYFQHQGEQLHRSYSIANSPTESGRIEFAASLISNGPGSLFLNQLQPGDHVEAKGPFGRLILKEPPPKRYIFIGTSTGITPYRAMLNTLSTALKNTALEVVLIQGVGTRKDTLYEDEFNAFAKSHPQMSYYSCLSREQKTTHPHERPGRIQSMLGELQLNAATDTVYLCGNPSMVDDIYQHLLDLNFTIQHIVREKYISR